MLPCCLKFVNVYHIFQGEMVCFCDAGGFDLVNSFEDGSGLNKMQKVDIRLIHCFMFIRAIMLVIVQMRKKGKIGTHEYFFFQKNMCSVTLLKKAHSFCTFL